MAPDGQAFFRTTSVQDFDLHQADRRRAARGKFSLKNALTALFPGPILPPDSVRGKLEENGKRGCCTGLAPAPLIAWHLGAKALCGLGASYNGIILRVRQDELDCGRKRPQSSDSQIAVPERGCGGPLWSWFASFHMGIDAHVRAIAMVSLHLGQKGGCNEHQV